jgi:hypothetical protein
MISGPETSAPGKPHKVKESRSTRHGVQKIEVGHKKPQKNKKHKKQLLFRSSLVFLFCAFVPFCG